MEPSKDWQFAINLILQTLNAEQEDPDTGPWNVNYKPDDADQFHTISVYKIGSNPDSGLVMEISNPIDAVHSFLHFFYTYELFRETREWIAAQRAVHDKQPAPETKDGYPMMVKVNGVLYDGKLRDTILTLIRVFNLKQEDAATIAIFFGLLIQRSSGQAHAIMFVSACLKDGINPVEHIGTICRQILKDHFA